MDRHIQTDKNKLCRQGDQLKSYMEMHDLTDIWKAVHREDKRYTCFGLNKSRIDLTLASPSFMSHVVDSSIGISYMSDHAPVIVDFTLEQDSQGPGFWRLPQYILSDPAYIHTIDNVIEDTVAKNRDLDPAQLWDFLKLSVSSKSIEFLAQSQQVKKAWVKQIDSDIKTVNIAREKAQTSTAIRCYTEKLSLLQWECDKIISFRTHQEQAYNAACKHYESNQST